MNNFRRDSKIYLTRPFLSGKHGTFKTVISSVMFNTWPTSHPWVQLPFSQPLSLSLHRTHFPHSWKSNRTTRKLSQKVGAKYRRVELSDCWTNCYFPVLEIDTEEMQNADLTEYKILLAEYIPDYFATWR